MDGFKSGLRFLFRVDLLTSNEPMMRVIEIAKRNGGPSFLRVNPASKFTRFVIELALVLTLVSFPVNLVAQQSPPPVTPIPLPAQAEQQPGSGAQLQTGTSSGLDAEARLQNLLADHQYAMIEAQLGKMPPDQAQFYRGILANRSNHLDAIHQVSRAPRRSGDERRKPRAPERVAQDAGRRLSTSRRMEQKPRQAYQSLESTLKDKLTQDDQDEIELPLKLLPLIAENSPAIVEPCDPFKLQVSEDPLGLVDVPVFVDARSRNWMLDPTLPFNLIARSTAKEVGLSISGESATITTLTGHPMQIHSTVVPRFTIGGRLTVRDMQAFVYDDKDYYFPQSSYQVEGVLGYPALAAIGSLTVNSDNTILVRPAKQIAPPAKDDQLTTGAPFYLDGDQVIVALGRASSAEEDATSPQIPNAPGQGTGLAARTDTAVHDDERMYAVDAGGQQTYLTSRYFDEHAGEFNNQKMAMYSFLGAQSPPQPAYTAENVPLQVGDSIITLHFIRVLTQPLGSAALDDVYGVLGTDALGQLKSYTFDYRTMRFTATAQ